MVTSVNGAKHGEFAMLHILLPMIGVQLTTPHVGSGDGPCPTIAAIGR